MDVPGAVNETPLETAQAALRSGPDEFDAYVARPVTAGLRPGVIVIHEAFGLNDHIRDVARRFAAAGFDAMAPDLYSRTGPPAPDDMGDLFTKMLALSDGTAIQDLEATAAALRALDSSNGKVGVIGFCSGGRHTLLFACSSSAPDAAVDCWGGFLDRASPDADVTPERPVPVLDLVDRLGCPLLAVGGAEDQNPSPAVLERLRQRLEAAGKDAEVRVFDAAGHAFFADYRPSYVPDAAHALWALVLDFFAKHLG
jgi:carboxymethylenebutenolidase